MNILVLDPSNITQNYTEHFCDSLSKQGVTVTLISNLNSDERPQRYKTRFKSISHFYQNITNNPTLLTRSLRQYLKGFQHLIDMFTLVNTIKKFSPNIIHYQQSPIPIIDRWFIRQLNKICPTVLTVHNTEPFHGDASLIQKLGFKSFVREFSHYIVHTKYSQEQLIGHFGVLEKDITVLNHPLFGNKDELNEYKPSTKDQPDKLPPILFFGNIRKYKGLDYLIKAFSLIDKNIRKKTTLIVAGSPRTSMDKLVNLAKFLGVNENIEWHLKYITDGELDFLFRTSGVIALPYRHIDGSGVISTAIKYRLPTVATNIGGFQEIIEHGKNGFLFEPSDVQSCATYLTQILTNNDLRKNMILAMDAVADSWISWQSFAKKSILVYETLERSKTANSR